MDIALRYEQATRRFEGGEIQQAEALLADIMLGFGAEAEQAMRTAYDMYRWGREEHLKSQVRDALASRPEDLFLKSLAVLVDVIAAKYAAIKALDEADKKQRVDLFADRSNDVLIVSVTVPITTCNYRCSYCFLNHQVKPDLDKLANLGKIIDRLGAIPRPLGVALAPAGEILAVPAIWPYFERLGRLPNVAWVEIWSNLSRDLDGLFEYIAPAKLRVIGTYHPTEFKSFERDNQRFFERVAALKQIVGDITINVVVCEDNLPYLPELRRRLRELDVYLTFNPQINSSNGYAQPIKPLDAEEKQIARELIDNPFLDYFFLEHKRADIRCTAGRDLIDVRYDGNISRCEFLAHEPDESLGNLLDPEGPRVDRTNRFCKFGGCACKSTIGYAEPFVAQYKRVGTQHHFVRRAAGEIGTHSFDPLEVPAAEAPLAKADAD